MLFVRQGGNWIATVTGSGRTKAIARASAMRNAMPAKPSIARAPWVIVLWDRDGAKNVLGPFATEKEADLAVCRITERWEDENGTDFVYPYEIDVIRMERSDTPAAPKR